MAPMSGIGMMLKSMGIDPEQISQAVEGIMHLAQSIDTRLSAIEKDIAEIKAMQNGTTPAPDVPVAIISETAQ